MSQMCYEHGTVAQLQQLCKLDVKSLVNLFQTIENNYFAQPKKTKVNLMKIFFDSLFYFTFFRLLPMYLPKVLFRQLKSTSITDATFNWTRKQAGF